jgi:hypothetical protein
VASSFEGILRYFRLRTLGVYGTSGRSYRAKNTREGL